MADRSDTRPEAGKDEVWVECVYCQGQEGYFDPERDEWIDCTYCEGTGGHVEYVVAWIRHGEGDEATAAELADAALVSGEDA